MFLNKHSKLLKDSQRFNLAEIAQKDMWEDFLSRCEEKTFLDSWNWGEFNKKLGNKIWRLCVFNSASRELFSAALVVKIKAKRGTFLFVPHGPIIIQNSKFKIQNDNFKFKILETLLGGLKKIAKEEGASFIRIAPIWLACQSIACPPKPEGRRRGEGGERNGGNIKIFRDLGFKDAPIHMHPEITWELDITPPENELFAGMRKTTRYLIRQARKNADIKIEQDNSLEGVEKFDKIYQETKERHHFTPFSPDYLKNQFAAFADDGQIAVFFGKYKDEVVSSAIIVFWQNLAFYHHGASSLKYSKIPVSYLLQWEAIREAKIRGCGIYNFWGIAPLSIAMESGNPKSETRNPKPETRNAASWLRDGQIQNSKSQISNKNHPWYGLTLFKMGFGGYKKEYVKTQDLILSPKYWFNYIIELARKIKRGL